MEDKNFLCIQVYGHDKQDAINEAYKQLEAEAKRLGCILPVTPYQPMQYVAYQPYQIQPEWYAPGINVQNPQPVPINIQYTYQSSSTAAPILSQRFPAMRLIPRQDYAQDNWFYEYRNPFSGDTFRPQRNNDFQYEARTPDRDWQPQGCNCNVCTKKTDPFNEYKPFHISAAEAEQKAKELTAALHGSRQPQGCNCNVCKTVKQLGMNRNYAPAEPIPFLWNYRETDDKNTAAALEQTAEDIAKVFDIPPSILGDLTDTPHGAINGLKVTDLIEDEAAEYEPSTIKDLEETIANMSLADGDAYLYGEYDKIKGLKTPMYQYKNTDAAIDESNDPNDGNTQPLVEKQTAIELLKRGQSCTDGTYTIIVSDLCTFRVMQETDWYQVFCAAKVSFNDRIEELKEFRNEIEDPMNRQYILPPFLITEPIWEPYEH